MTSKRNRGSYSVDSAERCVYIRWDAGLDVASLLSDLRRISTDPGYAPGYDELLDLRGARFETSERELRGLALNLAAMLPVLGSRRTAWVAEDDLSYGMIRVLIALNEDDRHSMNLFRNLDLACRWLGLDESRKRPLQADTASAKGFHLNDVTPRSSTC